VQTFSRWSEQQEERAMRNVWFKVMVVAAVITVLGEGASAQEFRVPLIVQESAGIARQNEPVSGGVPLPMGLVKGPTDVRLLDAQGTEVSAQFSVINRWGADRSVMWLLVQSVATVPANGKVTYYLVRGPAMVKRELLQVSESDKAVTVDTGVIKFRVRKKPADLLDAVWLDANGDGRYADDEQILRRGQYQLWFPSGSVFTLKDDKQYASYYWSAPRPREVLVEDSGPERATIVVRGLHAPDAGKGALPYCYGYLVRIRAYAGKPFLRISYTFTDDSYPPIGSPVCKEAVIRIPLKLAGKVTADLGGKKSRPAALAPGERRTMIWMDEKRLILPLMRGELIPDLDYVAASDGRLGANLAVRYLKENHPSALQVKRDEHVVWLEFKPWPAEAEGEHYLDVCSHKTYELQLTFAPGEEAIKKGRELFASFDNYLRFWPTVEWTSSTRAFGDFGYVAVPDEEARERILKAGNLGPFRTTGWRLFGSTPSMQSGSSGAPGGGYEPLITDARYYLAYMQTGDRQCFDQLERTSWFWRDRRYIHLDKDISKEHWTGRGGVYRRYAFEGHGAYPDLQPADFERRYSGAWNYGGAWGPMDTQHFSVDEIVNYYYLTGDRQSLIGMSRLGEEAAYFVSDFVSKVGKADVGRAHGWVIRALVSVYEATGEKRWMDLVREGVHAVCASQDKTAGTTYDVHKTQTPFMGAAVGMALGRYYRHHPEEEVRDALLGISDWLYYDVAKYAGGFSYRWSTEDPGKRSASGNRCMSTMSWAYLATGQMRYLEAADLHAGELWPWYLSGFGQEYVTIKRTARADRTLPAAVTDLGARPLGGGKVQLSWTAPGDDDSEGQASEYQVKYATKEIKEHADWRTEADKAVSFWAATNCKGEPKPSPAGTREAFTVEGLEAGTYWFALKSYDEQPNQSDLSNVVKVTVR